jgi:hypothetical protein
MMRGAMMFCMVKRVGKLSLQLLRLIKKKEQKKRKEKRKKEKAEMV